MSKFIKFGDEYINFDSVWIIRHVHGERGVTLAFKNEWQGRRWEDCGSIEAAQKRLDELLVLLNGLDATILHGPIDARYA